MIVFGGGEMKIARLSGSRMLLGYESEGMRRACVSIGDGMTARE